MNRTLISDKTNAKVKDRAPADYLASRDSFPSGATSELLRPHFVADTALEALQAATEEDEQSEVSNHYEAFRAAREAAIIEEIRSVCGIQSGIEESNAVSGSEGSAVVTENNWDARNAYPKRRDTP